MKWLKNHSIISFSAGLEDHSVHDVNTSRSRVVVVALALTAASKVKDKVVLQHGDKSAYFRKKNNSLTCP